MIIFPLSLFGFTDACIFVNVGGDNGGSGGGVVVAVDSVAGFCFAAAGVDVVTVCLIATGSGLCCNFGVSRIIIAASTVSGFGVFNPGVDMVA